ncbi:hypothetical protein DUI87_17938 [Hirundo rustica rustica]|uniref:Uncharacterized protein n=1 Tax=Hirundo rustica rustica TaxID=333673 RepID=A0A3M0JUT9_HIRRU|nr:hypothetical protein DUI87_17938 [Hirundo rustica rustica]
MDGFVEVCASAGRLRHAKRIMCFAKEAVENLPKWNWTLKGTFKLNSSRDYVKMRVSDVCCSVAPCEVVTFHDISVLAVAEVPNKSVTDRKELLSWNITYSKKGLRTFPGRVELVEKLSQGNSMSHGQRDGVKFKEQHCKRETNPKHSIKIRKIGDQNFQQAQNRFESYPPQISVVKVSFEDLSQQTEEQCGQQGKGGVLSLSSSLVRPYLHCCIQLWGPKHRKDMDLLEKIQSMATKTSRGMEHFYKERLKELGLFRLEQRRLQGDPVVAFQYLESEPAKKMERDSLQGPGVTGQEGMASN